MTEQPFDIVHDNQCLGYGLLLMKRLGTPVVATIHHPIHIDRSIEFAQARNLWDKFRLWRWFSFIPMQHSVSTRLDRVVTVSESSADDIRTMFGVRRESLRVVFNGVDVDFFGNNGHVSREPHRLIMVSSGNGHTKGLRYLLEAVRRLRHETPLRLTVVGNDDPEAVPAQLTREFGLDDIVTLTGRVERQELADLYSASEIAVVPSLHEGFGFPAAEAMSSRLPVVSTTAGALPEVVGVDGDAGLLIPPADSGALAAALGRLLKDEPLRRGMGERGRKRVVDNFSWRQAARKTVAVYEELV
jgi:glycosyltransferase involved in cell wall biosynthesis